MTNPDPIQPPPRRHLRRVPAQQPRCEPDPPSGEAVADRRPARLTVRTEADLLALIPYTFGFHPHRSVVLMVLGDGGRPMFARVDLPTDQAQHDAASVELLHAATVNGGRRAVL